MKKINLLSIVLLSIFLVGCSTKREYFSPQKEEISGKASFDNKTGSEILYVTKSGITLKNGKVITKDEKSFNLNLEKKEKFLNYSDEKIITSTIDGNLKILDKNSNLIFDEKFPSQPVSASLIGTKLAVVCADNSIWMIDINSKNVILSDKFDTTFTLDSRIASPLFAGNGVVVFPTLDGRVVITVNGMKAQDIFVSAEPFFNNIIYLDVFGDKMFAATNSTLILISPSGNKRLLQNIRDIFRYEDRIYLFRKDGIAQIYDLNLNEIKESKFKFAIFSGVMPHKDSIYIFEKTGYLIKTDLNLENSQIYKLNDELDKLSFASIENFYHKDRFIKLK